MSKEKEKQKTTWQEDLEKVELLMKIGNQNSLKTIRKIPLLIQQDFIHSVAKEKTE